MSRKRTLLAEPIDNPAGVWLFVDADGELVFECGTCFAWWFESGGELGDELVCRTCSARRYADRMRRPPAPPTDDGDVGREPATWFAEQGGLDDPAVIAELVRGGHFERARLLLAEHERRRIRAEMLGAGDASPESDDESVDD